MLLELGQTSVQDSHLYTLNCVMITFYILLTIGLVHNLKHMGYFLFAFLQKKNTIGINYAPVICNHAPYPLQVPGNSGDFDFRSNQC